MKPIWYPLFTLAVVGLAGYVAYSNWGWWRADDQVIKYVGFLLGALVTFMAWGISMGLAAGLDSIIRNHSEQDWRVCWEANMVSLRGVDGVSGSLSGGVFMISGHVDSEQFYRYYTLDKDGAFKPHKWIADSRTRVFEKERKDGKVVQWDEHFKRDWVLWFATPGSNLSMDFYIPIGSLRQNFTLE